MQKPALGFVLGGALGVADGLSLLVSAPETAPQIVVIVIAATFQGLITGLVIGLAIRRVSSPSMAIAIGLGIGLALASVVAYMQSTAGQAYWWQILVPGGLLGMAVGYGTYRYGKSDDVESVPEPALSSRTEAGSP